MIKTLSLVALALAIGVGAALAEEANAPEAAAASGASGEGVSAALSAQELLAYCVYNGRVFSPGIEICARKGFAYKCNSATKDKEAQWSAVSGTCAGGSESPP